MSEPHVSLATTPSLLRAGEHRCPLHSSEEQRTPPRLRSTCLTGIGSALPGRVLSNSAFPAALDTSDEWIRSRTGIRERRIAGLDETSATLGLAASQMALASAGLSARDLDMIIFATVTPDSAVPSNACRIQAELGCRSIGAFDVSGACTGFLQALNIASQFIATGACEQILVVGSEVLSRTLDFNDRTSCILFGDGAGAFVVSGTDQCDRGLRWSRIFSDGLRGELIWMPSHVSHAQPPLQDAPGKLRYRGGKYVQLNGREVYKFAVRCMVALVQEALLSVSLPSLERVFLVPHQVNQRIIDAALTELPIPLERVILNLERCGNTSAASIPIALDEAIRDGIVGPGDHLVLVAFGGGMTWGAAVLTL